MKRTIIPLLLLLGIFLFDFLFWQEKPGINLPLFTALLLIYSLWDNFYKLRKKEVLLAITAGAISGTMVIWNNTGLSISIHIFSIMIALGVIKQEKLSSSLEGIVGFLVTYVTVPFNWFSGLQQHKEQNKSLALVYSFIKLGILPIGLFLVFFVIYREASPKFEALTRSLIGWLEGFFKEFNFARAIFILFGFSLVAFGLHRKGYLLDALISGSDRLTRKRSNLKHLFFKPIEI